MFDVRSGVGITFMTMTLGLLPNLLNASISPPSAGDESATQAVLSIPVSKAADARIFSGTFVARGPVSRGICRWTETWTFTAASFDLGRKRADFTGRLVHTPLVTGCVSNDLSTSHRNVPLTVNGNSVRFTATWGDFRVTVTATVSGEFLNGTFVAAPRPPWSGSASGTFRLQSASLGISLKRDSLVSISATGNPSGGRFSYSARRIAGSNAAAVQGGDPAANPNRAELKNPSNPNPNGAPVQGGLAEITATYTKNGQATKKLSVATFGLSCYNNALEAEWGTPPSNCQSVRISGVTYSGAVTDPHGLRGVYCSSFIAQVRLQGSGITRDGRKIQYNPSGVGRMAEVQEIRAADGTPVVAGRTLARDPNIIPKGVRVDIAGVGASLEANDIGGAITNYRIDLYMGPGNAVCEDFANKIAITACQPGNAKCPAKNIPE